MAPPNYTSLAEISKIHAELGETFASRLTLPFEFREHQLLQFARMVQDNQDLLSRALADDLGRPTLEAHQTEIGPLVERALISASSLRRWATPEDKTSEVPDWQKSWQVKVHKQPKGTVLNIAPWNYPVILSLQPLLGAVAAGCTCVIKPSELAPAVSRAVAQIVPKYMDSRAYRVVEGAINETTKLLELKWDHIFYTGNGRVARIIAAAAAKHLTPTTLELGGKSPVIIDPKYPDFDVMAKRILWGKYCNAGQICVSPDFCLLPSKDHLDPLVSSFKKAYDSFFSNGDPLKTADYSHIISEQHFDRLTSLLAETKGKIVIGGKSDKTSLKIQPTIVVFDATTLDLKTIEEDALMKAEIFGPVLPVIVLSGGIPATTQFVSKLDHGLVLYCFSEDLDVKEHVLTRTMSGNLVFNDTFMQLAVNEIPFGGVGESGHGRQILKYSFDAFSYERSSLDMPLSEEPILSNRYPPYGQEALEFFKGLVNVPIPSSTPEGGLKK